jgi:hypothetical protein
MAGRHADDRASYRRSRCGVPVTPATQAVLSDQTGQAADADPVLLSQITVEYAGPIVRQEQLHPIGSQTVR